MQQFATSLNEPLVLFSLNLLFTSHLVPFPSLFPHLFRASGINTFCLLILMAVTKDFSTFMSHFRIKKKYLLIGIFFRIFWPDRVIFLVFKYVKIGKHGSNSKIKNERRIYVMVFIRKSRMYRTYYNILEYSVKSICIPVY